MRYLPEIRTRLLKEIARGLWGNRTATRRTVMRFADE